MKDSRGDVECKDANSKLGGFIKTNTSANGAAFIISLATPQGFAVPRHQR